VLRHAVLTCALAAALVSACSGGDAAADEPVLPASSFREVVVAELEAAGVDAEPASELDVQVREGLNRAELALADAFADYRRDPGGRDAIVAELVDEAKRRLREGISAVPYAEARSKLMPLLKPRFALREVGEAAQTAVPGNLVVIYAVEREHDFTVVTPADAVRWGKTVAELHEVALANLVRQTNAKEELLCEEDLCGWASGDGYDATRMVVPALRRQIEREYGGPAVYAVPMEKVFVALPLRLATRPSTEKLLKAKVERDFTTADDPVSPELFVERGGQLVLYR
jgi:Protein of unknown function (DUF1444)